MNPVTPDVAALVRRALLRGFAAPPGVRVEHVSGCPILVVAATSAVRCRINGTPVAQVTPEWFLHDGERPFRHRIGGVLIAAIHAVDGMLVRSGRQHSLIAESALVPIDRRVHRYLLRVRTRSARRSSGSRCRNIKKLLWGARANETPIGIHRPRRRFDGVEFAFAPARRRARRSAPSETSCYFAMLT